MSEFPLANDHDDIPRFDPWLRVMSASLVPVIVALYVPAGFKAILIAITVLLFLAGLAMFAAENRRKKRSES